MNTGPEMNTGLEQLGLLRPLAISSADSIHGDLGLPD